VERRWGNNGILRRDRVKNFKGTGYRYPARGPLQLFSRGCAYTAVWQPVLIFYIVVCIKIYIVAWVARYRVVSVMESGAEGPGSNRSRDAVG